MPMMAKNGQLLNTEDLYFHQNMSHCLIMCPSIMEVSVGLQVRYVFTPHMYVVHELHEFLSGEPIKLSWPAEEIATFYAKMLDHEYTSKEAFQKNFFSDWKEV